MNTSPLCPPLKAVTKSELGDGAPTLSGSSLWRLVGEKEGGRGGLRMLVVMGRRTGEEVRRGGEGVRGGDAPMGE